MFDLLLLETTLDDKTARAIDGPCSTHFCKHVLDDVLRLPVHTLADIGNVGEDGLLVTFAHDLRRCDGVTPASRCEESGVGCVQLAIEPVEELYGWVSQCTTPPDTIDVLPHRCNHGRSSTMLRFRTQGSHPRQRERTDHLQARPRRPPVSGSPLHPRRRPHPSL